MFPRRTFCCLCLLASLVIATPAADAGPLRTWFVDSLVKVFPSDPAGRNRLSRPEFSVARNQHLSIQLAVRSSRPMPDFSAEVTPLQSTDGRNITGAAVHSAGYVVVGSHTKDTPAGELVGEAPGWFPDPLFDLPIQLESNRTRSLWVTLAVPGDAAPGLYRGAIVVRSGGRRLARNEFRVRVYHPTVPERRSLMVTNWFNLSDKTSRQFYGVPQFSDGWWTLVENLGKVMADHRQNMVITPLLSLIQARSESDHLVFDFSNFDRWVETFRSAGVIGYIEGGHLLGRAGSYDAALTVNILEIDNGKAVQKTVPPDDPRAATFMQSLLSTLNSHLDEKGWKDIYLQHILDEPHGTEPPYYARYAGLVHRWLPGVRTMDAVDAENMPEELKTHCDVWVPQLGRFDNQMDLIRSRILGGREVWFYTCLFPNKQYMNRLIDYPLLKVRLLHWLNFRYQLSGYLHWGWNYWTPEPVNDTQPVIDANTELLPPGDAFIVYPDRENKSVFSSIRLEAMREGIEDFELLVLLKQRNPAEADRLSQAAVISLTDYLRTPAAFRRLEQRLLEALSR